MDRSLLPEPKPKAAAKVKQDAINLIRVGRVFNRSENSVNKVEASSRAWSNSDQAKANRGSQGRNNRAKVAGGNRASQEWSNSLKVKANRASQEWSNSAKKADKARAVRVEKRAEVPASKAVKANSRCLRLVRRAVNSCRAKYPV